MGTVHNRKELFSGKFSKVARVPMQEGAACGGVVVLVHGVANV